MRTTKLTITVLAAGLIAACGHSATPIPAATPAPAATSAPAKGAGSGSGSGPSPAVTTTRAATPVSAAARAKPSGSGDPRFGTQYAIFESGRPATRQITYDLIEWYDGAQAVKACAEDGHHPDANDYCQGWYIRNNNKKLRTLTVDPDAPIRMTVGGTAKPVDLPTFVREADRGTVIRFDVDAGRIVRLEHVYLP